MKVASISGGKDSVAMLHLMMERGIKPEKAIYYDNGMEFDAVYETLAKVKIFCESNKIEFVCLKSSFDFMYYMLNKPVRGRPAGITGYSWCGGICRWGTSDKTKVIDTYLSHYTGVEEYIGIAVDEPKRIKDKIYPLVEWGYTEEMCLDYCYNLGYTWEENGVRLYDILDRVSCWCCANKNLKELKNIYKYLPNYWERLKELESQTFKTMKRGKTLEELERRFSLE